MELYNEKASIIHHQRLIHKKILRLDNKEQEYNRLITACLTATTHKKK